VAIILDASVTIAAMLRDETSELAERAFDEGTRTGIVVPPIWVLEVPNVLLTVQRKGRIPRGHADDLLRTLRSLPIEVDRYPTHLPPPRVLSIAREHNLSVYDASYAELALRRGLPLATLDKRLATAAQSLGVASHA
jgi:predicted nucleic acid-binding protein